MDTVAIATYSTVYIQLNLSTQEVPIAELRTD